jgi:hypothetical protein
MSGTDGSQFFGTPSPWLGNTDPQVGPTRDAVLLVADAAVAAGRAILLDVTVAGTVRYELVSGALINLNVQANQLYEFNDAVVKLHSTGTSATLTAYVKY